MLSNSSVFLWFRHTAKITFFCLTISLSELLCSSQAFCKPLLSPSGLKVTDNYSQIGIDNAHPHFAWILNSDERGQFPAAFQLMVFSEDFNMSGSSAVVWNSGKVISDRQFGITYEGTPLKSLTSYLWKVRTWDRSGRMSPWSKPSKFVTGFLTNDDWDKKAGWIRFSGAVSKDINPLPIFRKDFKLAKPVKHAWLCLSGLGQFVAYINGKKIGSHVMDPAWTDYDKTVNYVMFDLTKDVKRGSNVIGVMLGNGLFANKGMRDFGPLKLIAQLKIVYADGSVRQIVSDTTWKAKPSPFTKATFDGSEDYDARLAGNDWPVRVKVSKGWGKAVPTDAPKGELIAQSSPPVTVYKRFKPVRIYYPAPGKIVYDFGQNMNGQFGFTVNGATGSVIKLMPGEDTTAQGLALKGRTLGCTYVLNGKKDEHWRLSFSSIGFRYLQIDNVSDKKGHATMPLIANVFADFVCTSSNDIGTFVTSDDRYNKIYAMAINTLRSNLISIHTDGPNYERLGWQEVTYTLLPSSSYCLDLYNLFKKITHDIRDAQRLSGLSPDIAPNFFAKKNTTSTSPYDDAPAWGASMFIVPWEIYGTYGDSTILREMYPHMKDYLTYLKTKETSAGVVTYGLGDWMAAGGGEVANVEGAIYVLDTKTLSAIAGVLKTADTAFYKSEYLRVTAAYNNAFYDPAIKRYLPTSQSSLALPLTFGIVPDTSKLQVYKELVKDIHEPKEDGTLPSYGKPGEFGSVLPDHVTTGDIATSFLWRSLGEAGEADIVQKMIMQPDAPSYLNMINKGCTTMTENWNIPKTRSHNHDMYAGIVEYFYKYLGGISSITPGYQEIKLKPIFPKGLVNVKASTVTVRGLVSSNWTVKGNHTDWKFTIPVNSSAQVYTPVQPNLTVSESGHMIWKDNKNCAEVPGLNFKGHETDPVSGKIYLVWIATSGNYDFKW